MKAITAGEFIRTLKRIEEETGGDDFLIFYVKYKNIEVEVTLGQYFSEENPIPDSGASERMKSNQVADLNIIPSYPKSGQVYFFCENPEISDYVNWIFGEAKDFEWAFNKCRVRDDDIIIIDAPYEPLEGPFDTINGVLTKITNDGVDVTLHIEPYNGSVNTQRKPDVYEVTYTVWEQNKYSVDIEAYSEEEAEAIFEEDNNNSTYPDKKDFEVVSVEKT